MRNSILIFKITFKVLIRALGCSSWSLYHTLAVLSLEVEKTKSSVTRILGRRKSRIVIIPPKLQDLLMNFPSMSLVYEVALAGGDVPLADGGVRRPRVHVDVVQGSARYVLSVAPGFKKEVVASSNLQSGAAGYIAAAMLPKQTLVSMWNSRKSIYKTFGTI